ncbi:MAG: hypothetical protein JRM74_04695 [Nitrososphaerota archaeon]|nr:hypothetical protein [Nitrososphaerota archaeon]
MLAISFSLGTSQLPVHRWPYDHFPYSGPTNLFAAPRSYRRKEATEQPRRGRDDSEGSDLVVHLPPGQMKFCQNYATQKKISLDSFIRMIVAQGIQATADADGCA